MSTSAEMDKYIPTPGSVTMFTTTWCGYCKRLKKQMDDAGVSYTEVNIEETPGTADIVGSFNNGNHTVPTVIFPDGSAATNPSLADLQFRLQVH
jgi:mycoredoxin